jgi:hypothetical protein
MNPSFSSGEPWLALTSAQRHADGQLKQAAYLRHLPPAGSLGEPEMCSH